VSPWLILVLVIYPVTEWLIASWLATIIGWGGVLLTMAVLMIIGIAVMRRAGFAAARSLRPVSVDGATVVPGMTQERAGQVGREVGDAGTLFVAGLLIALPGLITSVVGLLLLVPPVRRRARAVVARALRRRADAAGLRMTATTTTTVQGAVVREDDAVRPARGEIISGEVVSRDDEPTV
jgi:UPF0716 protein FxsA